jgi:hypothetical protein
MTRTGISTVCVLGSGRSGPRSSTTNVMRRFCRSRAASAPGVVKLDPTALGVLQSPKIPGWIQLYENFPTTHRPEADPAYLTQMVYSVAASSVYPPSASGFSATQQGTSASPKNSAARSTSGPGSRSGGGDGGGDDGVGEAGAGTGLGVVGLAPHAVTPRATSALRTTMISGRVKQSDTGVLLGPRNLGCRWSRCLTYAKARSLSTPRSRPLEAAASIDVGFTSFLPLVQAFTELFVYRATVMSPSIRA